MTKYFCFLLLVISCSLSNVHAQRWKKNNKESKIVEKAKEDFQSLISEKQFPYIERFHQGVRDMIAGNLSEAKATFKAIEHEYPHNDAIYFALGEIAKRQKLKTEALKYFSLAHQKDPNNIHYVQELAFLHLEKAEFSEAVKFLELLVAREPRNIEWLYAYGQALVYNQEYKKAIAAFDKLQDQTGPVPEIVGIKVELHKELKQLDLAEKELLALKKAFPNDLDILKEVIGFYESIANEEKAIELIKELVLADPSDGVAHFILARQYIEEKDFDNYLNSLVVVAGSDKIEFQDKIQLMQPAFEFQDPYFARLEEITRILMQTHPDQARTFAIHAEVLNVLGKTREGLKYYRKSLELDPDEYRLWTSVLAFESAYKEYEKLYEDGKKAVELFPSLPFVYYVTSEAAIQLGKIDEAEELLIMGEMFIIDDAHQLAKFTMRKAEIAFLRGDKTEGKALFDDALRLSPKSDRVIFSYAFHLAYHFKDFKKAQKLIDGIWKKKEMGALAYYTQAQIWILKGDYPQALSLLEEGIKQMDFKAELYDLKGDVLFLQGDSTAAKEIWQKAITGESRNIMIERKIQESEYHAPVYR